MAQRVGHGKPQNMSKTREAPSLTIIKPTLIVPGFTTSPNLLLVIVIHEQSRLFRSFGIRRDLLSGVHPWSAPRSFLGLFRVWDCFSSPNSVHYIDSITSNLASGELGPNLGVMHLGSGTEAPVTQSPQVGLAQI